METYDRTERVIKAFIWNFAALMIFLLVAYSFDDPPKFWEFFSYICPCGAGVVAGAGLYFDGKKSSPVAVGKQFVVTCRKSSRQVLDGRSGLAPTTAPLTRIEITHYVALPFASTEVVSSKVRTSYWWLKPWKWSVTERAYYAVSVILLFFGVIGYINAHGSCRSVAIVFFGLILSIGCLANYARLLKSEPDEKLKKAMGRPGWSTNIFAVLAFTLPFVIFLVLKFWSGLLVTNGHWLRCSQ